MFELLQFGPQFVYQVCQRQVFADEVFRQPGAGHAVAALGVLDGLADDQLPVLERYRADEGGEVFPLRFAPWPAGATGVAGRKLRHALLPFSRGDKRNPP
jgi:hypothetical protein